MCIRDRSKYTPTEFIPGCKYYQGYRSPNNAEREDKGYSAAWLHHKGRNKHHYEYWIDYSVGPVKGMTGMKMPNRYVAEMMMDRMAASKIYNKGHYDQHESLKYYEKGKDSYMIHDETRALLEHLDVYKRQQKDGAWYVVTRNSEPVGQQDTTVVLEPGMAPVSYTHLDVYKRQDQVRLRP